MTQLTIQQAFDLALQHHAAGRLREAGEIYRQILAQQPQHSAAMHFLGVIAHRTGRSDAALDLIRRAIAINPNSPEAYNNLANVLKDKGLLDDAIAAYHRAVAMNGNFAEAYNNLGAALKDSGQLDQAIAACRRAIELRPTLAEAYSNLGNALREKRRLDEAVAAYRQAVALKPNYADAHSNLANVLTDKGEWQEALAACRQAIALRPDFAEAYLNLGNVLKAIGQLNESVAAYRQALSINPNFAAAHNNLGSALKRNLQLDEAIASYRQALTLEPGFPEAYTNIGNALKDCGRLDEAISAFRRAIALKPNDAATHSSFILALQLHPGQDARALADELGCWNRLHAQPLRRFIQPHSNDRSPDRRLRIGYVSADMRDHVVGRNLLPLFQQHDRRQFEVFCYSQVLRPDAMTREFQRHADRWRDITDLSDEQAAEQIREDRIDLLVNLTLHTANNRLLIFARKPAPVQVTWLGYPGSTGLSAIDYRLTDPYLDPPGEGDSDYTEESIRLPHSFVCYDEAAMTYGFETIPQVAPLPALANHYVTFGSLNDFCKINEPLLKMWAGVLHAVSGSRLLLLASDGSHRARTRDWFAHNGIDSERIEFVQRAPRRQYLEYYNRIDIGLDTLPYGGYTTSLDSYWMGVPVITLAGKTVVGRAGVSHVMNLGLSEMLARTPEQFVEAAWKLASDVPRLSELRAHLRQRLARSPLSDAPRFARDIEGAYRELWRRWCSEHGTNRSRPDRG